MGMGWFEMSSFTGDLLIEQKGLNDFVEFKRDMFYYTNDEKMMVTIKAGFYTDLDSIPPILKSFVRASPIRSWRAYALHDALYRIGFDLKKSDIILNDALELLNIGGYARGKVYYGLRMFGSPTTYDDLILNAHKFVEIF